VQAMPRPA